MLTLRQAMELAGRNLVDTLSPAHGGMPFWNVEIDRGGRAACNMSYPSHNVGRWWDALLRLEAATGFAIPAEAEAVMLRHLESLFDNDNITRADGSVAAAGDLHTHSLFGTYRGLLLTRTAA